MSSRRRSSPIPTLGRELPDPNYQAVPMRVGSQTGPLGSSPTNLGLPSGTVQLPSSLGGSTVKIANLLAYAQNIDLSIDTVLSQSTLFLAQSDSWRNMVMFRNGSLAANIYIGCGQDASARSTIKLLPGDTMMLLDTVVPQGDLYYFADAAAGLLCCLYSTIKPDWVQQ